MLRVDHEDLNISSSFKQIIVYSDGHNSDNQCVDGLINVLIIYSFSLNQNPGLFMLENSVHGWNIWIGDNSAPPGLNIYTRFKYLHPG